ncbi:FAD-binding protein [Burkholderia multivorans]|uniref:FAD-binding protein n=1 Tax=Burkholderia ubonensis TaxID=101571 RepID=UPI000F6E8D22|nr:FAD-binding protein [Burkholderia ubonensis]AYZ64984.1 FAD-binding protein [Burkholderia multivorans]VWB05001.1 oxygenase [Burkholderia ubonensis]
MSTPETDVVIVGAGPVGLLCAYLGRLCNLRTLVVDKSAAPLQAGRADALNARTLQLLEVVDLFDDLYPKGKPCNTSSVWAGGKFVSRQSTWWDALEGCFHKHFLMLGQSFVEQLLDQKLKDVDAAVRRNTSVTDIKVADDGCTTTLSTGETIKSRFVIGADGSRSFVRDLFEVPFEVTRPQLIWAVLDGVIETDFVKVPEIIVFQAETSDVAWIPREGNLDRFYVRMDTKEFTVEQAIAKINRAMQPHALRFKELVWYSQFSVKESVAEHYAIADRVFLAGDACHIHSVNGGQGLNTGLADAFNIMWKMSMVLGSGSPAELLRTYEQERKPVAMGVVETSSQLVRSTKYSETGTHADDYVKIVEKRAGYITGMGIRYGEHELHGKRLPDFMVRNDGEQADTRIYSLLDYRFFTLLVFGDCNATLDLPAFVKVIRIRDETSPYANQMILVRPDSYIAASSSLSDASPITAYFDSMLSRAVA